MARGQQRPALAGLESDPRWRRESALRQELSGLQIFMIVMSAVIGTGIFAGDGEALHAAGPGGLMMALTIVGLIAIAMLEGLSGLLQLFPAPNALVEYVKYFVDEDLAYVVGILYWYSWAATFQVQTSTGANFTSQWGATTGGQVGLFYILWPIAVCIINLAPVKVFGWIELVGGTLKLIMMSIIVFIMFYLAGGFGKAPTYLQDGFQSDPSQTKNWAATLCLVIAYVAFSFEGVEVIGVTAFEARSLPALRRPSKVLGYVVLAVYLVYAFSEICTISWADGSLQKLPYDVGQATPVSSPALLSPILILAANKANNAGLAKAFTGILIYSGISSSNIALYVASRTLYGLFGSLGHRYAVLKILQQESKNTDVPTWCVLISAFAFWWIPFSQLSNSVATQHLIQIMSFSASTACIFVWAAVSFAYLRYYWWASKARSEGLFSKELDGMRIYSRYNRNILGDGRGLTLLWKFQPWVTAFGCVGSLLILYVFTTALWWSAPVTAAEVTSLYAVPVLAPLIWLIFKLHRWVANGYTTQQEGHQFQPYFWWVTTENNAILERIINSFDDIKATHQALSEKKNRQD